jgi:hypothetical protein
MLEGPGRPAFSPRVSVVLPTASRGFGDDAAGLQFNLPFSKQTGDVYWHWNAGLTWISEMSSPFLAGSAILRLLPMVHALVETVVEFPEVPGGGGTARETAVTLSPGARGGWDIGEHQLIVGVAVPVTWGEGTRQEAAFVYLSYELPFRR